MSGRRVKWDQPFVLPDGTNMPHPHHENGGATHNANCRCTMATTVDPSVATPKPAPNPAPTPTAAPVDELPPTPPPPAKNPRRQAAARRAGEASAERRREIYSAARSNLPPELHAVWDKEGHKFMREDAWRIKGVKDPINASSTLSQAFAEKYGSGAETIFGTEGDRFHLRAEIDARTAVDWDDEQQRKHWAALEREYQDNPPAPVNFDDEDPPF